MEEQKRRLKLARSLKIGIAILSITIGILGPLRSVPAVTDWISVRAINLIAAFMLLIAILMSAYGLYQGLFNILFLVTAISCCFAGEYLGKIIHYYIVKPSPIIRMVGTAVVTIVAALYS